MCYKQSPDKRLNWKLLGLFPWGGMFPRELVTFFRYHLASLKLTKPAVPEVGNTAIWRNGFHLIPSERFLDVMETTNTRKGIE